MYSEEIGINSLTFCETDTFQDHVLRPFTPVMSGNTEHLVAQATNYGANITSSALARISNDIIHPTAIAEGIAAIPNGWNEKRFRFHMDVTIKTRGSEIRQILSGYTDYLGAYNGHIDPNMVLIFNNCLQVAVTTAVNSNGAYTATTVRDACHVLSDTPASMMSVNSMEDQMVSMRPTDVFSTIEGQTYGQFVGGTVQDPRAGFTLGDKKSRRSNSNPASFLSNTLSAYDIITNVVDEDYGESTSAFRTPDTEAAAVIRDPDLGLDLFLGAFNTSKGTSGSARIPWGSIVAHCPHATCDSVTKVIMNDPKLISKSVVAGDSEGLGGADMATNIASTVVQSLPAVLFDNLMTSISFTAFRSLDTDSNYDVLLSNYWMIASGIDPTPYLERIRSMIIFTILPNVTRNGQLDVFLDVTVDVMGSTTIKLTLNGTEHRQFVFASFADAIYAPVMARGTGHLESIAHDVNLINKSMRGI
jgi:hypothetical protein